MFDFPGKLQTFSWNNFVFCSGLWLTFFLCASMAGGKIILKLRSTNLSKKDEVIVCDPHWTIKQVKELAQKSIEGNPVWFAFTLIYFWCVCLNRTSDRWICNGLLTWSDLFNVQVLLHLFQYAYRLWSGSVSYCLLMQDVKHQKYIYGGKYLADNMTLTSVFKVIILFVLQQTLL